MALPHLTLDNTNVLTVENIYFKTIIFFFFCLGKLNAHQEFSEKSSCMTVTEASVPVQSFHLSLPNPIKLLSHRSRCCICLLYEAAHHTSLLKQRVSTECRQANFCYWELTGRWDGNQGEGSSDILRAFTFQLLKNLDIYQNISILVCGMYIRVCVCVCTLQGVRIWENNL